MEGYRRKTRSDTVHREVCGVQDRSKRKDRIRERLALRNKVKEEEHLEIYGGLREEIGMKTSLHGPMDYAKETETAISCRGPGPASKKREV